MNFCEIYITIFSCEQNLFECWHFSGNIFLVQAIAGGITKEPSKAADDQDAVQYSENAPISGFSIRYQVYRR